MLQTLHSITTDMYFKFYIHVGQNESQSIATVMPDQVDEEQVSSSESDSETEEVVEKQSEHPRVVSKLGHQPAQLHGKYDPNRYC